ncbi:hypothetical protein [Algoriphagus formosus]|uniref:hypothetical protein n=1 Tax=Algoriphagus formosus TaxID=2007308 RepID=UPI000C28ABC9|nr:hypothetical protein [Algoriphagus formosus]
MKAKEIDPVFELLQRATAKIYPNYSLFLEEFLEKLKPFIYNEQSKAKAHFIHLVGFEQRKRARKIITDVLELLQWQNETIFLWESQDLNGPSLVSQAVAMQNTYAEFPKVIVTDGLYEFFYELQYENLRLCEEGKPVINFLQERESLNFPSSKSNPLRANGNLIISFIPSFEMFEAEYIGGMFNFLWENPANNFENFRRSYFPNELKNLVEKGLLNQKELIFFSKDESITIQTVMNVISLKPIIESQGRQILATQVEITSRTLSYFHLYVIYKKLSYPKLKKEALAFFDPVFRQYPRLASNLPKLEKPEKVKLDFIGGWRFSVEGELL